MSAKLNLIQVARYCKYKPGTIRTYCTTKHFPHHIENDKVVFYLKEVNEWLKTHFKRKEVLYGDN